ncbi:hypothetical protein B2G71_02520 [Novosphingobium sp. PC22D]|uniref:DUF3617 domain-containing protein n=1 Tax=Novosphingobium sp. PC22D TaxID=1962403 RepID=UPI000BFAFF58|nr:DUF3617 domain-containing protein [Novosphingobium sp. PC22D]PEQ14733.1 hypothetical protein B2G71_02520 [Novosphingobium sp. PC22D]
MKYGFTLAGAALVASLLAACDSSQAPQETGPKTMAEAKEEAGKINRPRPGQYKQVIEITKFELPNLPKEDSDKMAASLKTTQETEFCLTQEQSEKGFKDMFEDVGKGGECRYSRFDVSGGKVGAQLDCASVTEGTATFVLAGTVGPEGSDVTIDADMKNAQSPMGTAKIGMHMKTTRLGDCPASPAPAAQ